MKTRVSCFLLAVFVSIVIASVSTGAAVAQSNPPADTAVLGSRISINVVVTDKKGQPIRGLDAGDFTVLDNKAPQKLLAFRAVDEDALLQDHLHVVIVVDTINSDFSVVAREREQIRAFLKQNASDLANPTSIATFAESGAQVGEGFSNDGNTLNATLDKQKSEVRIEGRGTGFYGDADHFRQSLVQLGELLSYEATVPGRKLILIISPGWPMLSHAGFEADMKHRAEVFKSVVQLTNGIRESNVGLYCIYPFDAGRNTFYYQTFLKGVSSPNNAEYPNLALQVLAEHSGGQVIFEGGDVQAGLNTAVRDASAGYELTFEAARGDRQNEYHAIEVRVNRPNVIVRTTSGYYAHAQSSGQ